MEDNTKCDCPLCGRNITLKDGETRREYLVKGIMAMMNDMQKTVTEIAPFCPRCGKESMKEELLTNSLSRYADVYICDECGTDEAIRDASSKPPLPFDYWFIVACLLDK